MWCKTIVVLCCVLLPAIMAWLVDDYCPEVCPYHYAPVCGSDGKTYENKCMLDAAVCSSDGENEDLTVAYEGPCLMTKKAGSLPSNHIPCMKTCPRNYVPVCGTNGKTYVSKCIVENLRKCTPGNNELVVAYEGQCHEGSMLRIRKIDNPCPEVCHFHYAPVCGSDGKTYGNRCMLDAAACSSDRENEDLTVAYQGPCLMTKKAHSLHSNNIPKECMKACRIDYDPVCGNDGRTYPNKCVLENKACEPGNSQLEVECQGPCQICSVVPFHSDDIKPRAIGDCYKPCSRRHSPVCGTDRKTYSNKCIMENMACRSGKNVTVAFEGPCQEKPRSSCFKNCTREYDPVCANDGKTYSSKCIVENKACEPGNSQLEVECQGPCKMCRKPSVVLFHSDDIKAKAIHSDQMPNRDCSKLCRPNYSPVCGTDGKTYANRCVLENKACESDNSELAMKYDGQCH